MSLLVAHTKEPITRSAAGSVIDLNDEAGQPDLFAPPRCTADGNIATDRSTAGRSDGGDMPAIEAEETEDDVIARLRLLPRRNVVIALVVDGRPWRVDELVKAIALHRGAMIGVHHLTEHSGEARETYLNEQALTTDKRAVFRKPEDDVQSSEENNVAAMTAVGALADRPPAQYHGALAPRTDAPHFAGWPAGLTWQGALVYTSFSPAELRRWEKAGAIRFRRVGRHGAKVVMRGELDQLLDLVFGANAVDVREDFDFG